MNWTERDIVSRMNRRFSWACDANPTGALITRRNFTKVLYKKKHTGSRPRIESLTPKGAESHFSFTRSRVTGFPCKAFPT